MKKPEALVALYGSEDRASLPNRRKVILYLPALDRTVRYRTRPDNPIHEPCQTFRPICWGDNPRHQMVRSCCRGVHQSSAADAEHDTRAGWSKRDRAHRSDGSSGSRVLALCPRNFAGRSASTSLKLNRPTYPARLPSERNQKKFLNSETEAGDQR